jgi:hypothetical protein
MSPTTRLATISALSLALAALAPAALAQPTPTPAPAPPDAGTPAPAPPPAPAPTTAPPDGATAAPAPDDAAIKAMVAAEVEKQLAAQKAKGDHDFDAGLDDGAAKGSTKDLTGQDGFVDTRLNLTLTNENMLVKPGETIPSVPGWHFGVPNTLGTLFFDNYDTRYSGYETLSHAVLYRNYHRDHLEVEGALVVRLNELATSNIALSDDGSYVLVSWWRDPEHHDPTRLSLTAFPVSADRFRLGYSYRLSWGGNEEYQRSLTAKPGIKLQYTGDKAYAFVGAKSATLLDPLTAEQVARLGFLGGAGVDVTDMVRLELNGGYFSRGNNELQDVQDQEVQLYGASAQIAIHQGMPVSSSLDYKLYKNDPERIGRLFQQATYPGGTSWLVMSEATLLGQTLKDPEKTGSTKVQYGAAGDVNFRMKMDRLRFRLDVSYRDLAFVLHSVPSLPSYSDFPKEYKITPNFFAAAGVDRNWSDKYTVGVVVGVERPATLTSPSGVPGDTTDNPSGTSTAVIRNNGQQTLITILPPGEKAVEQLAVKFSGQVNFGKLYAALVDVYYSYDGNNTQLQRGGPEDVFQYKFGQFNQLGMNVTLQAKF